MSLAINATTSSGIVLASDSRQSYRNQKGQARIGSDNASKLFQLSKRVGCAVTGVAFLSDEEGIKNISAFVEEFKRKNEMEKMDVAEIARRIHKFFSEKYDWEKRLSNLKTKVRRKLDRKNLEMIDDFREKNGVLKFKFKKSSGEEQQGVAGVDKINIMVAGFNDDGSHQVFVCYLPGEVKEKRNSKKKNKEYGASWVGQKDVTTRVVLGWDGRIFDLSFVRKSIKELGRKKVAQQLRNLEYQINWGTMTLQDAVDFCTLIIKTTEAIQRFSDGIKMNPGNIPGVGGPVDIAVITRDKGFVWVKKKVLKAGKERVDLDNLEGLK